MRRVVSLGRTSASLLVHPGRWPDARQHLSRAWRGPARGSSARPVVTQAPPRRDTTVVTLLDESRAAVLEPEWRQVAWAPGTGLVGAGLAVVQWPATDAAALGALVAAAADAGVPVVVWDVAPAGAPAADVEGAAGVVVTTAARAADYPDAQVASGAFQPRHTNPVRSTGKAGRGTIDVGATAEGETPAARLARRRFESVDLVGEGPGLLPAAAAAAASGAVVLAPAGSAELLGDLAVSADDEFLPGALERHRELRRRYAQRSVRAALSTHSATVAAGALLAAGDVADPARDTSVSAIVPTMRPDQIPHVLDFIRHQNHPEVELVLVTHGFDAEQETLEAARERELERVRVVAADKALTLGALMNIGVDAADGRYVAKMDDDNFYGRDYLADLVRTFDFTDAQVTGKWAHYTYLESSGATFLRFPAAENRYVKLVQGGTLLVPRAVAAEVRFEDLPRRVDTTFLEKIEAAGGRVYSADRYNFVSVRASSTDGHTWKITDSELLAKPSEQLFFGEPWAHVEV